MRRKQWLQMFAIGLAVFTLSRLAVAYLIFDGGESEPGQSIAWGVATALFWATGMSWITARRQSRSEGA